MQNSHKVLEEFCELLHFMIMKYCHNFHFKISRLPVRHLAVTDVANVYISDLAERQDPSVIGIWIYDLRIIVAP